MTNIKKLDVLEMNELGMMISVIQLDYQPENNEKMANLIEEHFNVKCTIEDINHYEFLHKEHEIMIKEDFELTSKRHAFFHNLI